MFIKSIYALILTNFWDEHLILEATENLPLEGFYVDRGVYIKNVLGGTKGSYQVKYRSVRK